MVTLISSHLNILSLHLFSCLCCHLFPALMFSLHEPSPHQDHFRVFCSKLMFCYIHISQGSLELHCLMWQPLSTWRFYIEINENKIEFKMQSLNCTNHSSSAQWSCVAVAIVSKQLQTTSPSQEFIRQCFSNVNMDTNLLETC